MASNGQTCAHCVQPVEVHEQDWDPNLTGTPRLWLHFGCEEDYWHEINVNQDAYPSAAGIRGAQ